MTYDEAKAERDMLEEAVSFYSAVLASFPKSKNGLTPDHVKESEEYQKAKFDYEASFSKLRAFNTYFVKTFKKETRHKT